jgi:hypothetical protein
MDRSGVQDTGLLVRAQPKKVGVLCENPAARAYRSNDVRTRSSMIANLPDDEARVRNVEKAIFVSCREVLVFGRSAQVVRIGRTNCREGRGTACAVT